MPIVHVLALALTCFARVVAASREAHLQYDHSFDPRAHKNPGKTEYHIDLDSLIEKALNSKTELRKLYNHYKAKHDVSHGQHETAERLKTFRQFLVEVQELQRDESIAWTPGITLMAHMTELEQELMMSGNVTDHLDSHLLDNECNEYQQEAVGEEENALQAAYGALPSSFDWRALGAVTPVKRQNKGGTCWTFAAVTPMEAWIKQLTGDLPDLSTQELADCVYYGFGKRYFKNGGMAHHAWDYIMKEGRIGYSAEIPAREYAGFGGCSYDKWAHNALEDYNVAINNIIVVQKDLSGPAALRVIVGSWCPVVVGINTVGSNLTKYKGGPFDPRTSDCVPGAKITHAVTIVGYDITYFYIKNSWGDHWGNDEYIWWVRAKGTKDCSIYQRPMYPRMVKTKKKE